MANHKSVNGMDQVAANVWKKVKSGTWSKARLAEELANIYKVGYDKSRQDIVGTFKAEGVFDAVEKFHTRYHAPEEDLLKEEGYVTLEDFDNGDHDGGIGVEPERSVDLLSTGVAATDGDWGPGSGEPEPTPGSDPESVSSSD